MLTFVDYCNSDDDCSPQLKAKDYMMLTVKLIVFIFILDCASNFANREDLVVFYDKTGQSVPVYFVDGDLDIFYWTAAHGHSEL